MNYDLQLCVPYGVFVCVCVCVCVCVFGNVGRWMASNDLDLDLPHFSLLVTTILRSSVSHPLHSVLCVCVCVCVTLCASCCCVVVVVVLRLQLTVHEYVHEHEHEHERFGNITHIIILPRPPKSYTAI